MKKLTKIFLLLSVFSSLFFSCKKNKDEVPKPQEQNENELITTLKLTLQDKSNAGSITYAQFRDKDGEGGLPPTSLDTINLGAGKSYNVLIQLLDETKNPADTISNDVLREADQHQFFYSASGGAQVTFAYTDYDKNKVPLGLKPTFTAGAASINKSGKIKVVLKHQGQDKPKSGSGNQAIGSTDIEIDFPVSIK